MSFFRRYKEFKYHGLAGVGILLIVWWFLSLVVDKIFLPNPIEVTREMISLLKQKELYIDIYQTFIRTALGLLWGSIAGIVMGLIAGCYKKIYLIFSFPIDFLRSIPATALFPLFIVIFGLGDSIKIFASGWVVMFVVFINTYYGVKNLSSSKLLLSKLKKLKFFKNIYLIVLPGALPSIVAGLRVALSLALVVELVAEMFLGSNYGLGTRIYNASTIFEMEEVYASIIIIGTVGYVLNVGIVQLEKKIVHWG